MENIYLVGAQEVQNAGAAMRSAAEDMKQAALNLSGVLEQHQRFMDNWLQTFEKILTDNKP